MVKKVINNPKDVTKEFYGLHLAREEETILMEEYFLLIMKNIPKGKLLYSLEGKRS